MRWTTIPSGVDGVIEVTEEDVRDLQRLVLAEYRVKERQKRALDFILSYFIKNCMEEVAECGSVLGVENREYFRPDLEGKKRVCCERRKGHRGNHRATAGNQRVEWWDIVR